MEETAQDQLYFLKNMERLKDEKMKTIHLNKQTVDFHPARSNFGLEDYDIDFRSDDKSVTDHINEHFRSAQSSTGQSQAALRVPSSTAQREDLKIGCLLHAKRPEEGQRANLKNARQKDTVVHQPFISLAELQQQAKTKKKEHTRLSELTQLVVQVGDVGNEGQDEDCELPPEPRQALREADFALSDTQSNLLGGLQAMSGLDSSQRDAQSMYEQDHADLPTAQKHERLNFEGHVSGQTQVMKAAL